MKNLALIFLKLEIESNLFENLMNATNLKIIFPVLFVKV